MAWTKAARFEIAAFAKAQDAVEYHAMVCRMLRTLDEARAARPPN